MRRLAMLLALVAGPTVAQPVTLGDYPAIQTRFGTLAVVRISNASQGLFLNGGGQALASNYSVKILGAFARAGEPFDWVLARTHHGGNMCGFTYVLLQLSAGRVARTEEFAPCYGTLEEVRLEPGRIEVDFSVPDIGVEIERYSFDGSALQVTRVASGGLPAAPAGAGPDVERWIGQHPTRIYDDPSELARFAAIIPLSELDALRAQSSVANAAERRGDWVFGYGCRPHDCNGHAGFWGLRISDGAAVAAFLVKGEPPRLYGRPEVLADPAVSTFLNEKRLP